MAVKQFVFLMHFAAAKSSDCQRGQVEPDVLADPLDPTKPRRPASAYTAQNGATEALFNEIYDAWKH